MSFSLIQAGSNLQTVDDNGVVSLPLTLPSGVSLATTRPARFLLYNQYAILVNTPTRPLTIDSNGVVRVLTPTAPSVAPTLSGVGGGSLSGTYAGVRFTYLVLDGSGNIISESDYSPASNSVTIVTNFLKATPVSVSSDSVSYRRLYRPVTNGATLFYWCDIADNSTTTVQNDIADASLGVAAAPVLGSAPDLTLIAEFRDRLWGVSRTAVDTLRYTEIGLMYAWPSDNQFPVPVVGADNLGVRALVARRDALGIGKMNQLLAMTGVDDTDFTLVRLSQNLGIVSQESAVVYRDTAFWLWEDGVYQWDDDGIFCISDGKVRSWFATDDYFNRDRFQYAFGYVDPVRNKYRLFLNEAGSTVNVLWVEYDINTKTWWGPHKSHTVLPNCAFTALDSNLVARPTIGTTDGDLYREQDTRTDGTDGIIDLDIVSKRFDVEEPDQDKYWGELSVVGKAQPAGTLDITQTVGELSATATTAQQWDLTKSRQRLNRVGAGKHAQFEFTNSEVDQDAVLFGVEINPVNILGRR